MLNEESIKDTPAVLVESVTDEKTESVEELVPPLPEYVQQSDSEIADCIAQAVAASFDERELTFISDEVVIPEEPEVPNADPETPEEQSIDAPAQQEESAVNVGPEKEAEATAPVEPKEQMTAPKPKEAPVLPLKPKISAPKQPEKAPAPVANQPKIPKSQVRSSISETLFVLLGDLRTRQRQDLPANNASLKTAEKHHAKVYKVQRVLAPVRHLILAIMLCAILGRKFSWMLFGFLGGENGIYAAVIFTALAMLTSWHNIVTLFNDVRCFRFSYDGMLLLTTLFGILEALTTHNTNTPLPLLAIAWCLTGTADALCTGGKLQGLRTVISGRKRVGVRMTKGKWEHTDVIGKAPASASGFVRHQEELDTWHTVWLVYGPLQLIISLVVSTFLSAKTDISFLSVLVLILSVSMPITGVLGCVRPFYVLSRRLGNHSAVSGWSGMKAMAGKKAMLIYDDDLFPSGMLAHKGLRLYANIPPAVMVSYGASLVLHTDTGLTEPFTRLVRETGAELYRVSAFQASEGGLTGKIGDADVVVGTYNFMQLLGCLPPSGAPKNGIYLSINGEVIGLFAIRFRGKKSSMAGFGRLVRERRLIPVAATRNFCVNPAFVKRWFQVPVGTFSCPKTETRRSLSEPAVLNRGVTCGFIITPGLSHYSRIVVGGRRGYRSGVAATLLSVILSFATGIWIAGKISAGAVPVLGPQLIIVQLLFGVCLEIMARISIR